MLWPCIESMGKDPIIPALHWAITKSGTEIRNKGAPITGIDILSLIESGIGIYAPK